MVTLQVANPNAAEVDGHVPEKKELLSVMVTVSICVEFELLV